MAGGVVPVHVTEGRGVRGRYRRPWKATTINPMLNYFESMLNELLRQGKVTYNVAALVDRLPVSKVPMQTFTSVEVEKLLDTFRGPARTRVVWHFALAGLCRGELCGLRWSDIDSRRGRSASSSPHPRRRRRKGRRGRHQVRDLDPCAAAHPGAPDSAQGRRAHAGR
jgi:integrase